MRLPITPGLLACMMLNLFLTLGGLAWLYDIDPLLAVGAVVLAVVLIAMPSRSRVVVRTTDADALEDAWGVIANVSEGDWSQQSPEWREAAERWRDTHLLRKDGGA